VTADLATITGMDVPTELLIGGQWTSGRSGVLPVVDPATEHAVAEVANASIEDALDAVTAAQDALPGWAATPPRQRGECLRRAWELMIQRSDALARLMVVENGKALKDAKAEIVTGVVIPPDWTTFWTQAIQQGFKPKIASVGKALLFPSAIEALGDKGQNLSSEVWWSPSHPFKSSLTGQSTKQLADAYTAATKKQWTQPIGFAHALFEVAADVMKRSRGPGERAATLDSLTKTNLETIVGPLAWGKGPVKNVAKTPLVGGQWRRGGSFKYDLVITSNATAPNIPAGGKMEAIG